MSPDNSSNEEKDRTSHTSNMDGDKTGDGRRTTEGIDAQNLHQLLGELRAEITRLKAHRAKEQAQNWIQRHPMLAVSLSAAIGASAGYGAALVRQPEPPTLSEQARHRLRQLAGDARRVAGNVGRTLSERASESGQNARRRLQKSGKQLAQQVQDAAKQEAAELADRAADQAQRVGIDSGEAVRQAVENVSKKFWQGRKAASEEGSELATELAEEATKAIEDSAESVRETVAEGDSMISLKGTLWTVAGLAAGGYLAAKMRRLL